jgi:hypothetical protein
MLARNILGVQSGYWVGNAADFYSEGTPFEPWSGNRKWQDFRELSQSVEENDGIILSHVGVTIRRGFGLDDWFYRHLKHTTQNYN